MLLQVWPVVPLVLVLVDEAVLAQDAVLDVLVVAQHLAQLDLWKWVLWFWTGFFHSGAWFRHGFQYNLREPYWAVGSCSISPPAEGTFQNVIFKTLRQSGKNAL